MAESEGLITTPFGPGARTPVVTLRASSPSAPRNDGKKRRLAMMGREATDNEIVPSFHVLFIGILDFGIV